MIQRWKRNVAKVMTGMVVASSMVLGTFGWNVAPLISNISTAMADENVQTGENANEETQTGENAHVHTIVIDKAVEPTCEKSGLTEGSHCSVCNEVILEQKVIPAKGHSFKKSTAKAKTGKNGTVVKTCSVCKKKVTVSTIYAPKTIQLKTTTYTYDGTAKKPAVTVKDSKGKVIAASNYNVSYSNNVKAGKATVKVTFKGNNYTGSLSKNFTIKARAINSKGMSVKLSKTKYEYTGKAIKPGVTVKYGKKTLKKGTDYTVTYSNNTKIGNNKAKVIIKGKGNYSGTVNKTFTIDRIDISKKKVSVIFSSNPQLGYTGKAVKPYIESVKIGAKELSTNDYNVKYSNNVKIGKNTAKVIITGKGIYKGIYVKKFSILGSASGKLNKNISWSMDVKTGTLTISGKGKMPNDKDPNNSSFPWMKNYRNCIKKIVVKKGITEIGDFAFLDCGFVKNISLPDGITRIGAVSFAGCGRDWENKKYYLDSIDIPASVKVIDHNAFNGSSIKNITLHKGLETIGVAAFKDTTRLKSITIPSTVTFIDEEAFEDSNVSKIVLPKGIKELKPWVLNGCANLSNLVIPENVTVIEWEALTGLGFAKKSKSIHIKSKKINSVGENALMNIKNCTIYVPKSKLSAYKKLFANKGQGKNVKIVGE